ncbi:MAG: TIGR00300 family protein [Pirellulales bacterium]|nr:TIGR00300 family protein [Pirellulales bacterium]
MVISAFCLAQRPANGGLLAIFYIPLFAATVTLTMPTTPAPSPSPHREEVEIRGHIIDSLLLPKILDTIMAGGGTFTIKNVQIGIQRHEPSHARIEVYAPTRSQLDQILAQISDHGAVPVTLHDAELRIADLAGAFPEEFYSTTNQRTEIRRQGRWLPVADQEMDCGIVVDGEGLARCVPMTDVQPGMMIVCGHQGVRVFPEERAASKQTFEFMNSPVSTEKPKGVAVRQIAEELFAARKSGAEALLVGGPAIVHTGSVPYVCELLRGGYFSHLFAGNALATHDLEHALYGTSLGVSLDKGDLLEAGHEHHLRAINRIRRAGSISAAVEQGLIKSGIMYECVRQNIDFLLAGSIRDDGPLPDVITDSLVAQREMRARIKNVTFCLMIATTLHSIAVGNLLPAWVKVVCVDINPSTVIKLQDRGSFQTVGLVTDVEPFLRALAQEVRALEHGQGSGNGE